MFSEALVQLSLTATSCSQKDLADRLGVSPAQISKWKKGDHMSQEMEDKLRRIAGIGDKEPLFILWAGSMENATKWEQLMRYLADVAETAAETGYNTYPLQDEYDLLPSRTIEILQQLGIAIPKEFPKELDLNYQDDDVNDVVDAIERNLYSDTISKIYKSLTEVYGFYAAYIDDLIYDDKLDLLNTPAANIEAELISLAASNIEIDSNMAPKFKEHRYRTRREFREWISVVKDAAFRNGIPLGAELLDLINNSSEELAHQAEAKSLGFNASRLHPDIYMNELLVGMRTIHQVLPAIMRKLGIDDKEFKLDLSELQLHS